MRARVVVAWGPGCWLAAALLRLPHMSHARAVRLLACPLQKKKREREAEAPEAAAPADGEKKKKKKKKDKGDA